MIVNLEGKIAVVTGAAKGIGKATAQALAENGAIVVIADRDEVSAQLTATNIPHSCVLKMDVSDQSDVEAGIAWVQAQFGRIDILVNNAGVNTLNHRVTIDQFPVEEWDRIIGVDLRGLFLVSQSVAQSMMKRRAGRIVNISSVLGLVPARLQCAFTTAKAGVINLTRTMAIELATSGILVNCVAPGSTITETTEKLFYASDGIMHEKSAQLIRHIPLGRPGRPEEIAQAILFLCASESSYVTGQTIAVDGGWSVGGFLRDF